MLGDDEVKLSVPKPACFTIGAGRQFIAGLGAGVVEAVLVVTPMETMKTKMIERHVDMGGCVRFIMRTDGIRGLYQGLTATTLKQASNQGMRFMFFNKYKDLVTNNGETPLGSIEAFLGGMAAGTFSTLGIENYLNAIFNRHSSVRLVCIINFRK